MPEKTVLITGCSQGGLGPAMVKAYRARGFKVFATVRVLSKAGDLVKMDGVEVLELDVASLESVKQCAKAVETITGGSLDVLVNNAGAVSVMPLLDVSIDDAKKEYDVNVWGMLAMSQAFAPMLIKTRGTVCNICSVSAEMVYAWSGVYASSKAANRMISEDLRLEMAPLGVHVTTVMLGGVAVDRNNPQKATSDIALPESSYYHKIAPAINRHYRGEVFKGNQDVDMAAKNIVSDVLDGTKPIIRRGNGSSMVWWLSMLLPRGLFTSVLNGDSGLDGFRK